MRMRIPAFVDEVVRDPRQRGILIAGSLALFAVGLVPRALSPGLPNAQEALRARPDVENLFLFLSFLSAGTVVLGGLAADLVRRRWLLLGGLVAMAGGCLVAVVVDDGPVYYAATAVAVAASGVVLAYGIGSVAIAYEGVPRATALGAVYAAYGAGSATAPALFTLLVVRIPSSDPSVPDGYAFETWLAYGAAALAALVALWAARRWVPAIPGSLPAPPRLVTAVAFWAIGVLAIVSGASGLTGAAVEVTPWVLLAGGLAVVIVATIGLRRAAQFVTGLQLDARGIAAALVVGVAVGFAQAVPLMLIPVVFQYPMGFGQLLALLAIGPFAIALFVAGPVSGALLQRFGPRGMMTLGSFMLGVSNLFVALILIWAGRSAHYLGFVIPLALIGAGFVLATTVRTAIVFASTPRGLPGSAAAINEASVALGSRIGIVTSTTVVAVAAMGSARSMAAGLPNADALLDEFAEALGAMGTPRFNEFLAAALGSAQQAKIDAYVIAYVDGVSAALVISGVIGIIGAGLAWVLTGRRDPLRTVFDLKEERATAVATEP
jgi:DHA2 family multidrug resistance protein-like MFS transporter